MNALAMNQFRTVPSNAKWTFTTRRVNRDDVAAMDTNFEAMNAGDLLLVEVEKVGNHKRFQLTTGRPSEIYVGDYGVVACAARYAPDQFEGIAEIGADRCDLLAGGGVAGKMRMANQLRAAPTRLRPIGRLLSADLKAINVRDYAIPTSRKTPNIPVLVVTGSSMNAGKTTMTASLAHGLQKAGYRVAGIKMTGTGAFGDFNAMTDAGLHYVGDFTDAGYASTYREPMDRIENAFLDLVGQAEEQGCEVAVVEIADGIYQKETAALLEKSSIIRNAATAFLFACGDAVSAVGGVQHLRGLGIEPAAVSGKISLSPMATIEASEAAKVSIVTRDELLTGEFAGTLLVRALEAASDRLISVA